MATTTVEQPRMDGLNNANHNADILDRLMADQDAEMDN
jgi:hypothetical protein